MLLIYLNRVIDGMKQKHQHKILEYMSYMRFLVNRSANYGFSISSTTSAVVFAIFGITKYGQYDLLLLLYILKI